jgi:predicted ATPase
MLEYLHLKNVGPAPEMAIHFKPRMNFLTGDNGLGKTFLLDIAWWVLTRTWAGMPAVPPRRGWKVPRGTATGTPVIDYRYHKNSGKSHEGEGIFNRAEQHWHLKSGRPTIPGIVVYAQADGGFSVWDPARNAWKEKDPEQADLPPAYRFLPREVWDGLPVDRPTKLCNGLILDWANWQRENGEAFRQLNSVLRVLSPSPKERLRPGRLTRIGVNDARDHPTLVTPYGQEVPLVLASAGIRRIVALAYLLVWTWQEHLRACEIRETNPARDIVFLVDEIEAHLHPRWQRRIVRALLDVMEALTESGEISLQMIATTHSPLVLASLEPMFDRDIDAVWELDLVDERVQLTEFPFRRVGDVNSWLTSSVFDLSEPRGLEAEEALGEALALLRKSPRPPLEDFERVDQRLRDVLGDIDPFWVRWSHHLEQMRGEA